MSIRKSQLQNLQTRINLIADEVLTTGTNLKNAKLLATYISKQGFNKKNKKLLELLPPLVKILFDFGELNLCLNIFDEAIRLNPTDKKIAQRREKVEQILKLNSSKKLIPQRQKEIEFDTSQYDIAGEIQQLEESNMNFSNSLFDESSSDQTIVSSSIHSIANIAPDYEKTLVPTQMPYETGGFATIPQPIMTNNPVSSMPTEIILEYPGLQNLSQRYEYIDILGEGGMGGVFLAFDTQLERKVAIKFMNAKCESNPDIAMRFIKEARAQALASHPGIISIYDVGTITNPFIVMEYVEGKTIKSIIKEDGGFPVSKSCEVMTFVAEALLFAHKKKIIHKDVKPDNIIIDEFNKPRLLDFGLAEQNSQPEKTNTPHQILGTPFYMAPEQISGGEISPATDIYSWGVMLYQLTTGVVPFTTGDILYHHVNTQPTPPKQLAMDIPSSVNKTILKCLEKDSQNRYSSFETVIQDLEKS